MLKTIKQACRFNPVIQDYRMAQDIENLADLISDQGDGREFFTRNFVTRGMEQLELVSRVARPDLDPSWPELRIVTLEIGR